MGPPLLRLPLSSEIWRSRERGKDGGCRGGAGADGVEAEKRVVVAVADGGGRASCDGRQLRLMSSWRVLVSVTVELGRE